MQEQEPCSSAGSKNIHWIIKKRTMPVNEFEKQVQDIMEDLKLPPSPPVWENIEEQIRKKKDRRRIIFWILFFFLILSGGLWLTIGRNDNRSKEQTARSEKTRVENPGTTVTASKKDQNAITNKHKETVVPITKKDDYKKTTIAKKLIERQQQGNNLVIKRSARKRIK